MPIFIERYLLPLLAGVTVLLSVTNPMHWDWKRRVIGCVAVICTAFLVSRMLHKYNLGRSLASIAVAPKPARLLIPSEIGRAHV